ncbi:hypothetical protein AAVH_36298, partial [Aphelenchoides avenae]
MIREFAADNEEEGENNCSDLPTEHEPDSVHAWDESDQADREEATMAPDGAPPQHAPHHESHAGHSLECCAVVTVIIVGYNAFTE